MNSHLMKRSPISKQPTDSAANSINSSRKEFLDDLPPKTRNTVRGVDLILINEAIVAIMEGRITINGKQPVTRKERYIAIASYFKTARTALNMFFDGPVNVQGDYSIAFKHKEIPHVIKYPESL
jgi:hypothetical protein